MEYQQFVIYTYWNNYDSRHGIHARLNNDDESIRRGLGEAARRERQASRAYWKAALGRALAVVRLARRPQRVAA